MKKFLCFMVVGICSILPYVVNADTGVNVTCDSDFDANGRKTCTVGYVIDQSTPQSSLSVTLTEHGGATIQDVRFVSDPNSDFSMGNPEESNGVWTISFTAPNTVSGEASLLQFTYQNSGMEDCKVRVSIGNDSKDTTPPADTTPDTPTENVQTGSTLPFIALGAIAIIAVGAYVVTKNKTKMYKI